ncbi:MAG: DUF6090 family protein [Balneola sp.]
MLKFFRKIRQKLLSESKFSKYLLYALGEIVLVVIGILIALAINNSYNYNEQRKTEKKYLLSLQSEFKVNLAKLDEEVKRNQDRVDAVNQILPLFDKSISDTVSNEYVSKLFFTVFGTTLDYEPSNGVLIDIVSAGNLNLFKNQKLREYLASFESSIEHYKRQESEANNVKGNLQRLYYKKGSVRNIMRALGEDFEYQSISENTNDKELFNSIEFENYLLDYLLTFSGANNDDYLGRIEKEIKEILNEINKELSK